MSCIAVVDFETTGLSLTMGDRFQSLMNAGQRIPPFIEALTGIKYHVGLRAFRCPCDG